MDLNDKIKLELSEVLKESKLKDICEKTGITYQNVSNMRRGVGNFGISTVIKVLKSLGYEVKIEVSKGEFKKEINV